ncbi:MAG: SOS response-associated peptidase [Methylobacterium sp.]|uniref:SOS response-associated peptidase n=1 Tax=Methylobacterium sp. TaxID=409 RepID=UPI0025D5108B|nr:SOS response-associated peptidase [Methylobacterium sp.]MBX9932915.1 SOS response-associated peptidase [Methylobacterium sp.]
MCGRFFMRQAPEIFRQFYGYSEQPNFPPRYNVAPTQPVAVVVSEGGEPHFRLMRWGFWPGWLKDPRDFPLIINARSETMAEKASFRGALRHRRCILLADDFYEWRREGSGKAATRTPFKIERADRAPMALAGLWETWASPDGSEVDTAAIVTTGANGVLAAIHDRMPAVLGRDDVASWLDTRSLDSGPAASLCRPCPEDWLTLDPVSARVNDARHDEPDLIEPVRAPNRSASGMDAPAPDRQRSSDEDAQGALF